MIIKQIYVTIGTISALLFGGDALSKEVEIYSFDNEPPYIYLDKNNHLTGIVIDIVNQASSRMPDYDVKITPLPWERAKTNIKRGKGFALLAPYFHAHDWVTDTIPVRPYIWPYSLKLLSLQDVVLCNSKSVSSKKSKFPGDFTGLRFVMHRGDGRNGTEFDQLVKTNEISLKYVKDPISTLMLVLLGRADCTTMSVLTYQYLLNELKNSSDYLTYSENAQLNEAYYSKLNDVYLGYTDIDDEENYPFKKDFSIKFDIEIYKMRQNGEIEDIISKYK